MTFEKEKIIRLYAANSVGGCIEIRPNPDAPDVGIEMHTTDERSEDHWGKFSLIMSPAEALELGETLAAYAEQFDEDNA